MKPSLKKTAEGSQTLRLEEFDETYHSTNGALTEAQHVFIENGLLKSPLKDIRILEVGFGTGLNALVTLEAFLGQEHLSSIHYTSLEKYPIAPEIYQNLNYGELTKPNLTSHFQLMHQSAWEEDIIIHKDFVLHKKEFDLLKKNITGTYDIIYYDAFAPSKQSPMWDDAVLAAVCKTLKEGGIFCTYCAKGSVRRSLQSNGLEMQRLPGPPGKREMLFGIKQEKGYR